MAAVGGISDQQWGESQITNVYSASTVVGGGDGQGGIAGNGNGNVSDSFWDTDVGPGSSAGGTGKTTSEMQEISTFSAWISEPSGITTARFGSSTRTTIIPGWDGSSKHRKPIKSTGWRCPPTFKPEIP